MCEDGFNWPKKDKRIGKNVNQKNGKERWKSNFLKFTDISSASCQLELCS